MGDLDDADRLYAQAGEEITAKEMRSFAWVELQRGLLALGRGRTGDAGAHYERANRAYSGYWLVNEYNAELLGASGRFDEAVALYEKVLARAPRPEIQQALGDLYVFMGKPDPRGPGTTRPSRRTSSRPGAAAFMISTTSPRSTPTCAKTAPRPKNGRARISRYGRITRPGRPSPGLSSAADESTKHSTK